MHFAHPFIKGAHRCPKFLLCPFNEVIGVRHAPLPRSAL